jgi:hypothetical protein
VGGAGQQLLQHGDARSHGYNPAQPRIDPPGSIRTPVAMLGVNSPIKYWFIANGRCFKVITRINGRYDAVYAVSSCRAPASDWSYPLFIGGSFLGGTPGVPDT